MGLGDTRSDPSSISMNAILRPTVPCTRRAAIRDAARATAALALGGCVGTSFPEEPATARDDGRLAVAVTPATSRAAPGTTALGLGDVRDGQLFVPAAADGGAPMPLALLLHGAGQDSNVLLQPMRPLAESLGLALLAVDSRGSTWDISRDGGFGADVAFIERALTHAFAHVAVDPTRLTVAGFSDGASYAISLGTVNGDLLRRIAAFSPGYWHRRPPHGTPPLFITHGQNDGVLPIDVTSRRLVPDLRASGYDVTYTEFAGGHAITRALLEQATRCLAGD